MLWGLSSQSPESKVCPGFVPETSSQQVEHLSLPIHCLTHLGLPTLACHGCCLGTWPCLLAVLGVSRNALESTRLPRGLHRLVVSPPRLEALVAFPGRFEEGTGVWRAPGGQLPPSKMKESRRVSQRGGGLSRWRLPGLCFSSVPWLAGSGPHPEGAWEWSGACGKEEDH